MDLVGIDFRQPAMSVRGKAIAIIDVEEHSNGGHNVSNVVRK